MNREILRLALPSIVSNITVPLLGLVDVAITGHLGSACYIGAIAFGGMIFNLLYWSFGFLRMGTSGMTAQAYGAADCERQLKVLLQASAVAFSIAFVILLFKNPLLDCALFFIDASREVEEYTAVYYRIVVWGAPALLVLYAFKGWFVGMQNTKYPMYIAIGINVVNILASLVFVYVFGMKIKGVAMGTVVAQYTGIVAAVLLWKYRYGKDFNKVSVSRRWFGKAAFSRFFTVNTAIFFRTLCLISVTTVFTWSGGRQGDVILAVNTLLMQLFTIFSYVFDGFAYAGESLAGRFTGEGNTFLRKKAVRSLLGWGTAVMLLFTLLYLSSGSAFLGLLTDNQEVIDVAERYFYWVAAVPLCGYAAFMWDGILIGMTAVRQMLVAVLTAAVVFFILFFLPPSLGDSFSPFWSDPFNNNRLWFSFLCYLSVRSIIESVWSGRKLLI